MDSQSLAMIHFFLLSREQSLACTDSSDLRDFHYQSEDLTVVASVDGCDDNHLTCANLVDAKLTGANLRGVDLTGVMTGGAFSCP